jgi:hypothetical protein
MEHLVVIPAVAITAEVNPVVVATTVVAIPAEGALQMMTVQPPLGMEKVVEVIPVLMVQSQLILPMARVPTPILMAIHSATMEVEMDPILCPMVPLVLILMMDQVLTPMLMEEIQP